MLVTQETLTELLPDLGDAFLSSAVPLLQLSQPPVFLPQLYSVPTDFA